MSRDDRAFGEVARWEVLDVFFIQFSLLTVRNLGLSVLPSIVILKASTAAADRLQLECGYGSLEGTCGLRSINNSAAANLHHGAAWK